MSSFVPICERPFDEHAFRICISVIARYFPFASASAFCADTPVDAPVDDTPVDWDDGE
jgi:hypothetical protein